MNQENLLKNFKENIGKFVNNPIVINNSNQSAIELKNNLLKPNKQETPSFLMKSEQKQIYGPNLAPLPPIQKVIQSSPLPGNSLNQQDYTGLEAKVESINQKLNNLENRVEKDEKITESTKEDIKDLKTNLDKNFNKLDGILEKLATKLK
jgi:hypothetical protein